MLEFTVDHPIPDPITNRFVAADAEPIRLLAFGPEFTRPVGDALLDQAKAGNSDNDGICPERFGDPKCG